MDTIEYRDVVDKTGWPSGQWMTEPDKVQWPDETTGLPCLVVRGPSGALCGYVGVTDNHPLHGVDYDSCPDAVHVAAHGGLTYSAPCAPTETEERGICHVPGVGESDDVWWLGFDCAHAWDFCPGHARLYSSPIDNEVYRSLGYVKARCRTLAAAISEAANDR